MDRKYNIVGIDGNAYSIMGYVCRAMKAEHCTEEEINAYIADAKSSNYDHLILVSYEMCEKLNKKEDEDFNPMEESKKFNNKKMNKRKLYESIMRNVSIQVKKALNEEFIKKDYIKEKATFQADYLYVGDPCYAISDYYYDKLIGIRDFEEGIIYEGDNVCCITCHTKDGDGNYIGEETDTDYVVDSGLIGVSNLRYIDNLSNIWKLEKDGMGEVVRIKSGECTVEFEYNDGIYDITIYDDNIKVFHDIINTLPNYEDEDDDYIPRHPSYFDEDEDEY